MAGWQAHTNENDEKSLKQLKKPMDLYSGGLTIQRIFASEIWGAYFWEGLFHFIFFCGGGGGGACYWNFTVFCVILLPLCRL